MRRLTPWTVRSVQHREARTVEGGNGAGNGHRLTGFTFHDVGEDQRVLAWANLPSGGLDSQVQGSYPGVG
ncbi:MAG TPA: hypothetical protein VGL55_00715 [Steroidobacteraceae bacterium]